jgi:hypothetical protein
VAPLVAVEEGEMFMSAIDTAAVTASDAIEGGCNNNNTTSTDQSF